jgi:leucyl-tRNA synthetase
MPVSRYSGGAEHTNMHLLYSRFFHKALFDLGLTNEPEPFKERMNRGLILGPDGQKMSKSKGNVVDPDEQVEKVGSDTVKMYLAFIGPYNEVGQYPWDLGGVVGVRRFLERVWKLGFGMRTSSDEPVENKKSDSLLHKTIKKVTEDIENYKFNTAISSLMVLLSEMEKSRAGKKTFEVFLRLLAPFAPHITEEIWSSFGHKSSIHLEEWPQFDESKIKEQSATIVIQINGKVRAQFEAPFGISESEAKNKAISMPEVQKWLTGGEPKKVIFVPNKILNFVF